VDGINNTVAQLGEMLRIGEHAFRSRTPV
jgi:hypothetical protein